jgi:AcrR family transcriptional regulator
MQYLSQRLALKSTRTRETERPRGPVAATQRQRLLAATEQLIAEKGAAAATIEAIVKLAGVSTVTFYEHFRNKEECIVAAFDEAVEELREAVAGESGERALAALLARLHAEPARARFCFVEAQKGGPKLRGRYEEVLDDVADELSDPLGRAIVGGLAWLLRERLELGGGEGVQDLLPRMKEIVLDPYLAPHG